MTLTELLQYHAIEGGLLDGDIAREIAQDAGFDTIDFDFDQLADEVNAHAIEETLRGNVLGARLFKTEHLTLAEMACGTITNGDIDWPSEMAFAAAMRDHGVSYSVTHVC